MHDVDEELPLCGTSAAPTSNFFVSRPFASRLGSDTTRSTTPSQAVSAASSAGEGIRSKPRGRPPLHYYRYAFFYFSFFAVLTFLVCKLEEQLLLVHARVAPPSSFPSISTTSSSAPSAPQLEQNIRMERAVFRFTVSSQLHEQEDADAPSSSSQLQKDGLPIAAVPVDGDGTGRMFMPEDKKDVQDFEALLTAGIGQFLREGLVPAEDHQDQLYPAAGAGDSSSAGADAAAGAGLKVAHFEMGFGRTPSFPRTPSRSAQPLSSGSVPPFSRTPSPPAAHVVVQRSSSKGTKQRQEKESKTLASSSSTSRERTLMREEEVDPDGEQVPFDEKVKESDPIAGQLLRELQQHKELPTTTSDHVALTEDGQLALTVDFVIDFDKVLGNKSMIPSEKLAQGGYTALLKDTVGDRVAAFLSGRARKKGGGRSLHVEFAKASLSGDLVNAYVQMVKRQTLKLQSKSLPSSSTSFLELELAQEHQVQGASARSSSSTAAPAGSLSQAELDLISLGEQWRVRCITCTAKAKFLSVSKKLPDSEVWISRMNRAARLCADLYTNVLIYEATETCADMENLNRRGMLLELGVNASLGLNATAYLAQGLNGTLASNNSVIFDVGDAVGGVVQLVAGNNGTSTHTPPLFLSTLQSALAEVFGLGVSDMLATVLPTVYVWNTNPGNMSAFVPPATTASGAPPNASSLLTASGASRIGSVISTTYLFFEFIMTHVDESQVFQNTSFQTIFQGRLDQTVLQHEVVVGEAREVYSQTVARADLAGTNSSNATIGAGNNATALLFSTLERMLAEKEGRSNTTSTNTSGASNTSASGGNSSSSSAAGGGTSTVAEELAMLSSSVEGLLKVASWCSGEMIQIAHQLPGDDVVTTGQVELDYRALFDDTETARVQQQNATANANAYDPTTRHYFAYKDFVLFEHPVLCMVLFSIVGCGLLATRSLVLSGVSAEQVK